MINDITKARPYAKVIFKLALSKKEEYLYIWEDYLKSLVTILQEYKKFVSFFDPRLSIENRMRMFNSCVSEIPSEINNLIILLLKEKRVYLLSSILKCYHEMVLDYYQILEVKIEAAHELSIEQKNIFISALEKRYNKKINLSVEINSNLLGGAIIYTADEKIDGSILGTIHKMKQNLMINPENI